MELVAASHLHLIDAPGEHEYDTDHRQAHDIDHQRRARPQKTIDARKTGRTHREDDKLVGAKGQGLKSIAYDCLLRCRKGSMYRIDSPAKMNAPPISVHCAG